MRNETIQDALGISDPFGDADDIKPTLNPMMALDPIEKSISPTEPITQSDTWSDYDYSRRVAQGNLEQAQIILQSAVEFVNSSPSARAFEVLGILTKTVNDCTGQLLDIQKKMRELAKEQGKGSGDDPKVINNFLLGDPTDALNQLKRMQREANEKGVGEVDE